MKLRIALLALVAAAGVLASMAVAKPPPGHGNPHDAGATTGTTGLSTTGTTTTTTELGTHGKVLVCHKLGNGRYVLVRVSVHSALAKGKHGNVLATNGTCPGPVQGYGSSTTTATTTATTVEPTTS